MNSFLPAPFFMFPRVNNITIKNTLLSGLIVVANAGNILIYFPCISKSITFPLTAQVTELVKQGKELLNIGTLAILFV